jgi:cytochrome c oxidase subunit 2
MVSVEQAPTCRRGKRTCAIAYRDHLHSRLGLRPSVAPARATAVLALALQTACEGPQSTLNTAGVGAEQIAELFWWMAGGAVLIWLLVIGLAIYTTRIQRKPQDRRIAQWLIVGGGIAFPVVVLTVLLAYGMYLLQPPAAPPGALRVEVAGERWWWRVRYVTPDGQAIDLANEIRLPVGETTEFILSSPDVIHSFWIPPLGGKVDMIPGRLTRLVLQPTRTGTFRGVCAEYCGASHAFMAFSVVVMEPQAFADWLAHQAAPAQPPADALAQRGQALFLANGCGGCHRIAGTPADGLIGPDLTHVGSRLSLGAGILPNEPDAYVRWIMHTDALKPGVNMPAYGMLPEQSVAAIAAYLNGLR